MAAPTRLSKEQVSGIFNAARKRVNENDAVDVTHRPMVILELAIRQLLKHGVKDSGYARNLIGFSSKETIYANTEMSHADAFNAAWNKVLSKARMETFHRCVGLVFNVSLQGIRGQAARNIKFLQAAEQGLENVPPLEIKAKNAGITFYEPSSIGWIAENIDPAKATQEKWNEFKQLFQSELKKYTNLRTSREDYAQILTEEDLF